MNDLEKEIAKLKAEGKLPDILKILNSYKYGVADSLPDKLYKLLEEDYLKNSTNQLRFGISLRAYGYDHRAVVLIYAENRVLEIVAKLSLGDLCE